MERVCQVCSAPVPQPEVSAAQGTLLSNGENTPNLLKGLVPGKTAKATCAACLSSFKDWIQVRRQSRLVQDGSSSQDPPQSVPKSLEPPSTPTPPGENQDDAHVKEDNYPFKKNLSPQVLRNRELKITSVDSSSLFTNYNVPSDDDSNSSSENNAQIQDNNFIVDEIVDTIDEPILEMKQICYTCNDCGKNYKCKSSLRKHLKFTHKFSNLIEKNTQTHDNQNQSSSKFEKLENVNRVPKLRESQRLKENNKLKNVKSENKSDCSEDMPNHIKNTGMICNLCGHTFRNISVFEIHQGDHLSKIPYECVVCHTILSEKQALDEHLNKMHNNAKPFTCKICGNAFRDINCLNSHLKQHENKCLDCGKIFTNTNLFREHAFSVHKQLKPFRCALCPKSYIERRHLLRHVAKIHNNGQNNNKNLSPSTPHNCTICKKTFLSLSGLKGHMISHREQRNYKCSICSKGFKKSSALTDHIVVHIKERPYKCKLLKPFRCALCPKSYTERRHLLRHVAKIHNNGQNNNKNLSPSTHNCTLCKKTFLSLSGLKGHNMISHREQRNYKCSICSKGFKKSSALTDHIVVHKKERPYKCNLCSKSFKRNKCLTKHKLLHTNEYNFECDGCGRKFKVKRYLTKHIRLRRCIVIVENKTI